MTEYFNRQNALIPHELWCDLCKDRQYCVVKETTLDNGTFILTTWIGHSDSHGPNGPEIFLTLLTEPKGGDIHRYRHATEEEALRHHNHLAGTYYDEQEYIPRWTSILDDIED